MDENKHVKEVDTVLDNKKLNQIFDIPNESNLPDTINKLKKELQTVEEDLEESDINPDIILQNNIERANNFLDKIEELMEQGKVTGVLLEAAGTLINAITSAANSIVGGSFNDEQVRLKDKALQLKEQELMIKQAINNKKGEESSDKGNTINAIFTDRESLLQMIKDQNKEITNN